MVYVSLAEYKCVASVNNESYTYYVRQFGSSYECVEAVSTDRAILQRTKELAAAVNTTDICPSAMDSATTATWLVKHPFSDTNEKLSPIPSNTYYATYSESAGDTQCSGDKTSMAVVVGNKIQLDTCFSGNTSYEKPLKTTLTMLEHVTGKILDSEANGEIMLLGDFTTTPIRFYCARYKVESETVKLSLDVLLKQNATCTKAQTETSAEPGKFVAFVLKAKPVPSTTRPGQPTTTTTTTVKPPTTTTQTTTTAPPTTSTPSPKTSTTITTTTKSPTTTTKPPTTTTKPPTITTTKPPTTTTTSTTTTTTTTKKPTTRPAPATSTADIKSNNTTMLIVILLVILAVIIIVIVIIAVVACQFRNRKKEEGILRNTFDTSFFGTKRVLPPGAVDGEELIA
ncbi:hypothetical protein NP493_4g05019 [Ridgeia piscesae]|uniref:Uncharacterized protein n=1 Tax=Ridgeia piscesae TaxID=27915 RepID=A0AAD9ULN2_RIDPI|nr:hypothetical protein NP493_4g05019 [Ridgeia piscesae]